MLLAAALMAGGTPELVDVGLQRRGAEIKIDRLEMLVLCACSV